MDRDLALGPAVRSQAAAIAQALQRLGWWSQTPPSAQALADPGAFGINSLTPAQWLQFILLPRVAEVLAGQGHFPIGSSVATWAFRELSSDDGTGDLLDLLRGFDELFQPSLFRVAAAWAPELDRFLSDPSFVDGDALFALPDGEDPQTWPQQQAELQVLFNNHAPLDWAAPQTGRTPLMTAIAFGCDRVEQLLLQHGADASRADLSGRTAADWRILRLQGRLRRLLPAATAVRSARLAQLYDPATRALSTALVTLELDGPLAADALARLPATDPAVVMVLGDDAVSALARLHPPFWSRHRPDPPIAVDATG